MKILRVVAIVTLIFVGATSIIGGVQLVADPSGNMLRMPMSLLDHSPFRSFLIPGFILLTANGLMSLAVLMLVLRRVREYGCWVALQGCILGGWITIQVLMIRQLIWAHYVYWAAALILLYCGWQLKYRSGDPHGAHHSAD